MYTFNGGCIVLSMPCRHLIGWLTGWLAGWFTVTLKVLKDTLVSGIIGFKIGRNMLVPLYGSPLGLVLFYSGIFIAQINLHLQCFWSWIKGENKNKRVDLLSLFSPLIFFFCSLLLMNLFLCSVTSGEQERASRDWIDWSARSLCAHHTLVLSLSFISSSGQLNNWACKPASKLTVSCD